MRLVLLTAITAAAGLAACAPLAPDGSYGTSYGYSAVETAPVVAAPYGGYEGGYAGAYGGYAPGPYYGQPAYPAPYATPYVAPYATTGTTVVLGGGGYRGYDRYRDEPRYERPRFEQPRYERPRFEQPRIEQPRFDGGYRGNPNAPGRDFGRQPGPQNYGGGGFRPGPSPVAAGRPAPPAPAPSAPPPQLQPMRGGLSPTAHSPEYDPGNPGAQGGADR